MMASSLFDGDAHSAEEGIEALARLTARRVPFGDIHVAHLLLASTADLGTAAVEQLRRAVRESGAIVARDQFVTEIWGERASGGPLSAEAMIGLYVALLRTRGLQITTFRARGYGIGHR